MSPLAFTRLSLTSAVGACFGYATSFVLSLYLGDVRLPRDHPATVRRRVWIISLLTVLAPPFLLFLSDNSSPNPNALNFPGLLDTLGIRIHGITAAVLYPVLLVPLLYLGHITQQLLDVRSWEGFTSLFSFLWTERRDIVLRNYVVAPVAEEVIFRSCMVPLLLPHLGSRWTIVLCPLFFGIAHLHHMFEHLKAGTLSPQQALINVTIQTLYTSLFGMFSAHLFLLTGHVISPIIAHSLCNFLGLPEVTGVPTHKHKYLVGVLYVVGLVSFLCSIYYTLQ